MIKIYNRHTKKYDIEKVAGETYLKWCYSSPVGMKLLELLVKKKVFSKLYGKFCDSSLSKRKISSFINDLDVDMSIYEKSIDDFSSFNDFFIRKVKPDARPITDDKNILISPGDGRLTALSNIELNKLVQIKNITYSLKELIGDDKVAEEYADGLCLILRLCPTDYHRFHFVDDGTCTKTKEISGSYYSVSPIALERIPKLFCQNKREWSILKSKNFDDVLCIEVGATCVGTIIQTYTPNVEITKGEEKGFFKFGGSTTILFFKKDTVEIDNDILEHSTLGIETQVFMGEEIGQKIL